MGMTVPLKKKENRYWNLFCNRLIRLYFSRWHRQKENCNQDRRLDFTSLKCYEAEITTAYFTEGHY